MLDDNLTGYFDQLLETGSNRGFLCDTNILRFDRTPIKRYSQLKEKIISDYNGFMLAPNSFMFDSLNRKVVQFVESGLAQKFVSKYFDTKKVAELNGPKVLTLDHLSAGFFVWLACLVVAIVGFVCERYSMKIIPNSLLAWDNDKFLNSTGMSRFNRDKRERRR